MIIYLFGDNLSNLRKYIADKFTILEYIKRNQETYSRIKANLDLLDSLSDTELQIHNSNERGIAIHLESPSRSQDEVYQKLSDAYWQACRKIYRAPTSLLQEKAERLLQKMRDRKMKEKEYLHLLETPQDVVIQGWAAEIRRERNLSPKGYSSQAAEDAMESAKRRSRAILEATKLDPEKLIKPFTI